MSIRDNYQADFVQLCEQQKYERIVQPENGTTILTYMIWQSDLGGLWGIEYFLGDQTYKTHRRHMYFNKEDVEGVLDYLPGYKLKKMSYSRFHDEIVARAKKGY